MHQPQQRSMSTYPALLEPVCRRRLPKAPDGERRSSSPRILPTPPPLSPDYRSPSAAANLERRPSGRLLPQPPVNGITTKIIEPHEQSISPVSLTPDPTVDEPNVEEDDFEQKSDEDDSKENLIEYEEPEEFNEAPLQTEPLTLRVTPPIEEVRLQSRRTSKFSIHSNDQVKSNSDSDDPVAHGLDPSLYSPNPRLSIESSQSPIYHKTSNASTSVLDPSADLKPRGLGLIHCSLQHFPVRKRLRVSILKIDGLAGELKPELEIHAICKVSIPGLKTGKEQTSEMKRGRTPVFNQEFFFDNVSHDELDTKSVFVQVFHQNSGKMGKDVIIGDASIPLRDIREMNTKKEIRIVEEIQAIIPKKLGKIYTSSVIEKDSKRLTINLKKVEDLPRGGLTGAPDVCVKITVTQDGRKQSKSSRILKNTTSAVYNEAVMFLFGTTKAELAQTEIVISVHDMQRESSGLDIIGCAYLGVGAVDKSECEQWKNTIEHLGKEYKGNHNLKPPVLTPPVHVAQESDDLDIS